MEDRLWDYIDGRSDAAERKAIEALLASDPALREQYADMRAAHAALAGAGLEEPSLRFTKNVMEAVAGESIAPATPTYVNKKVIRGIAGALLGLLGATFIYILVLLKRAPTGATNGVTGGATGGGTGAGLRIPVPQVSLPEFHLDPYLSVFIFIAIISGFVWLDALRQRKRAKTHH
jgi:hypothetical protein